MNEWIIANIDFTDVFDFGDNIPRMQLVGLECYGWCGTGVDELVFVNFFNVII